MKIYQLYRSLLKKYGQPMDFWKKWCQKNKTWQDKEEIILGAILTQRTNWRNVEMVFNKLREAHALSIKGIYRIGKNNRGPLERLIRSSGFYKQKAKRLFLLCEFIVKNYGASEKFFNQDLAICRRQLLEIYGIGPETADSILLYAGDKPIFVIDEYTRRFVKKYGISDKTSYDYLQQLFQENLPKNVQLYQDFHALIVLDGKKARFLIQ